MNWETTGKERDNNNGTTEVESFGVEEETGEVYFRWTPKHWYTRDDWFTLEDISGEKWMTPVKKMKPSRSRLQRRVEARKMRAWRRENGLSHGQSGKRKWQEH